MLLSILDWGIAYHETEGRIVGQEHLCRSSNSAPSRSGGDIRIEGALSLDPAQGAPADVRLIARDFVAVDMDDATVALAADLQFSGALPRYLLDGTVTVLPLEIRIPSALPASVTTIDVREIDSSTGEVLSRRPKPSAKPRHRVIRMLRWT